LKGEPAVVVPSIQNSAVTALAPASATPIIITQRNPDTKDSSIARRVFPGLHFPEYRWPRAWSIDFESTERLKLEEQII
jgi:hypothetical protein